MDFTFPKYNPTDRVKRIPHIKIESASPFAEKKFTPPQSNEPPPIIKITFFVNRYRFNLLLDR